MHAEGSAKGEVLVDGANFLSWEKKSIPAALLS